MRPLEIEEFYGLSTDRDGDRATGLRRETIAACQVPSRVGLGRSLAGPSPG